MSLPDRLVRLAAAAVVVLAPVALGGCGFQPVYGERGTTYATQDTIAQISIAPVRERVGQQLRNELIRRVSPDGEPAAPAYLMTMEIAISERDELVRDTREINRRSVTVSVAYKLVDTATLNTGDATVPPTVVYDNKAFAESSYNRFPNEFANIRARIDAENRATTEVAILIANQLAAASVGGRI